MIDRPSGSYIEDPTTGEITPNLEDHAMTARQLITHSSEEMPLLSAMSYELTIKEENDVKD